jgi:hypothetical protein
VTDEQKYTAFSGDRLLASGSLRDVLCQVKARFDADEATPILIFDDLTGEQVDFDLRGTPDEVLRRAMPAPRPAGPGRPRLGVVSREVSLLPRQWEWLEAQPNGISAALRRLVDEARKRDPERERARIATEAASRFMTAMGGNLPHFEEASRALFARDASRVDQLTSEWPRDVHEHLMRLVRRAIS